MTSGDPRAEFWNLHCGVPAFIGAQNRLNVVGHVHNAGNLERMTWSLNGASPYPAFVQDESMSARRLARPGDFNIDAIARSRLRERNRLMLTLHTRDGRALSQEMDFGVRTTAPARDESAKPRVFLDLDGVSYPEEVGQVVDGRWRVGTAPDGRRCLEIAPGDNGLDRVILFGKDSWTSGYTVRATLRVTRWIRKPCSVGVLFHWNPHLQGDGTSLPSSWSTGLGYFYSNCRGLRVRVGVDVHTDAAGIKHGDNVLAEAPLSRGWAAIDRWTSALARYSGRRLRPRARFVQLRPGVDYVFELAVEPSRYALTVRRAGAHRPPAQVVVPDPPLLLEGGAVGLIAHRCGVQVFNFEVKPLG